MSLKFYAMIDGEQRGPFELDELSEAGVTPDTYVWRKGLDDWRQASEDADICRHFRQRLFDLKSQKTVPVTPVEAETQPEIPEGPVYFRSFLGSKGFSVSPEEQDTSKKPASLLIPAILVTLFCSFILGLVSLYFVVRTSKAWNAGEDKLAWENHRKAKMWLGIAFFIGIVLNVIAAKYLTGSGLF